MEQLSHISNAGAVPAAPQGLPILTFLPGDLEILLLAPGQVMGANWGALHRTGAADLGEDPQMPVWQRFWKRIPSPGCQRG